MAPAMSERLMKKKILTSINKMIIMGTNSINIRCYLFQERQIVKNPKMIFIPDFDKRNTFVRKTICIMFDFDIVIYEFFYVFHFFLKMRTWKISKNQSWNIEIKENSSENTSLIGSNNGIVKRSSILIMFNQIIR